MIMKKTLLLSLLMTIAMALHAADPDSVYVKCYQQNPGGGLYVKYSVDKKTWFNIDRQLVSSDFGAWGSQKKMFAPVLNYCNKSGKFYAEWYVNEDVLHYATTETADLWVWKPQAYPSLRDKAALEAKKTELKSKKDNITIAPYSVIKALKDKVLAANRRSELENESMRDDARRYANLSGMQLNLSLNLNDADKRKAISPMLYGIFFEDINYSADGGLYAELIQNRDFEYTAADHDKWNSMTAWKVVGNGCTSKVVKDNPISRNNANNLLLKVTKPGDAKLVNEGWDGIALKAKAKYDLSLFLRGKSSVRVSLVDGDKTLATTVVKSTDAWKQYKAVLVPTADAEKAQLVIEPLAAGELAIDFVSLFPQDTFKGRKNGLRKDLAQVLADIKPQFVRFPGGCASHGQGIDNIYHWQATVGDLWDRQSDFNIWHYHQSRGLGFFEYFQFCEDIGAEPLPVLAAGVPCQNSWKGGHGQQGGLPFEKDLNGKPSPYTYNGKPLTMESYLQELLDLIEWANGDAKTSKLAQMRAKAGHPKPFNLKYLGIGNEDLISDIFVERFKFLEEGVKAKHPEITIVGTVGPFFEGSDYEYGWQLAKEKNLDLVDEHYYVNPGWYINHQDYYDNYSRTGTKVYLGEWASRGNTLENALAEAIHVTTLERNGDVVSMSSYAPLLAKYGHTQWNPDLIYFNNTKIDPTCNYWVQALSGQNAGDEYVYADRTVTFQREKNDRGRDINAIASAEVEKRIAHSVVVDKETGDIILKLVNALPQPTTLNVALGDIMGYGKTAKVQCLSGAYNAKNLAPVSSTIDVAYTLAYQMPAYSFTVIRIPKLSRKR